MAWGCAASGPPAQDLIAKCVSSTSLVILPFRKFGDDECIALCAALHGNQILTELSASGHKVGDAGLRALGRLLGNECCVLQRLAIGDASLGGTGLRSICDGIGVDKKCQLHHLDLGFKGIGEHKGDDPELMRLVCCCPELQNLELGRNPLGSKGVLALVGDGIWSANLDRLGLSECELDDEALDAMAHAAVNGGLPALRSLELAKNRGIGRSGSDALGRLIQHIPALTKLDVQHCDLDACSANALAPAIATHAALQELQLSGNPSLFGVLPISAASSTEREATQLYPPASFIQSSLPSRMAYEASLQLSDEERCTLELRTRLRQRIATANSDGPGRQSLRQLKLDCGGSASYVLMNARMLMIALQTAPKLHILKLASCNLFDDLAIALTSDSRPGAAFTELDVRSNRLGMVGAAALMGIDGIVRLSLFDNPLLGSSVADGAALGAALHATASMLEHLDLGACALDSPAHLRAIAAALSHGAATSLRCIEVFGNGADAGDEWMQALSELRASRPGLDVAWKEKPSNTESS